MDSTNPSHLSPLPADDDVLIRRQDIPRYIPVAAQTLARWAVEGRGPRFARIGGRVAYRTGDVRDWLGSRFRQNTSQAA